MRHVPVTGRLSGNLCYPRVVGGAQSVERDVGELLWVGFEGTRVPADLRARIADRRVGGVVLFARNLPARGDETDVPALVELIAELHAAAPSGSPLLVSIDQEGGRVQRVKAPATVWPPMLSFEGFRDPSTAVQMAFDVGSALGAELAVLGVDVDFAPILDVHTNAANPIIGDRAFATDPARAADRALAFARGLAAAGILACGKHFPGHGDTSTDSHLELPRVDRDLERLRAVELAPFAAAARVRLPMIMTAHVVFAAVDDRRPGTLSPAVIDGVLRRELGYAGVIVSDDLDMQAIRSHYGAGEAAVAAVTAGCDVVLLCRDPAAQRDAFDALVAGAEVDEVLRARIAEAAGRVRGLEQLRTPYLPGSAAAQELLGCDAHRDLAARLSEADGG